MKTPNILLTRDHFREGVFARDGNACVICGTPAKDAHHIVERRLFPDGGYYMDNGASLCEEHHRAAEATTLSCDEIRAACKIVHPVIPPHLYADQEIDKWGNPVLPNGNRLRGELFYDVSIQKAMEPVLHLFSKYVKYPRTFHCPWSPGRMNRDERTMPSMEQFIGQQVVVMEKMDGENTSMYSDYIHARSMETLDPHPSRSRVKALWSSICSDIPEGWRLSVENLYAKHSIHYKSLPDFAVLFAIWDENNVCRSWEETKEWGALLGLAMCPVLYEGIYDEDLIKRLHKEERNGDQCEGYVIRNSGSYPYGEFRKWVCKYVREGHVQNAHGHWKRGIFTPNEKKASTDNNE